MFAGHMLLLVFTLGAVFLLTVGNFSVIFGAVLVRDGHRHDFFELLVDRRCRPTSSPC